MQLRNIVVFWPLLLIGCGSAPAILPAGYTVDIAPPAHETDLQKIDEAISKNEFIMVSQPNKQIRFSRDTSGILLQVWEWQHRRSTTVRVYKLEDTNGYSANLTDFQTSGMTLVGEPCRKYLEFVSALKVQFGTDRSRLKFYKETCDAS
jgi:hypothetical protein